jgi:hypothetical protein
MLKAGLNEGDVMRTWILAAATGAALGIASPDMADAQAASTRSSRATQVPTKEQDRREAEREKLREARTGTGDSRNSASQAERERIELERARAEQVRRAGDNRARTVQDTRARQEAIAREEERDRLRRQREAYEASHRPTDRYSDGRYYDDRYDDYTYGYGYDNDRYDRDGRPTNWRNTNSPPFCRSGAGHPVHGRQWCRDKGYSLGNDQWGRDSWGNILLGASRDRRLERYDQTFSRNILADLLGSVLLNRFENYGRQYSQGSTTGRWSLDGGASVLQLYVGGLPVARLVDMNRDGRVDNVYLRN